MAADARRAQGSQRSDPQSSATVLHRVHGERAINPLHTPKSASSYLHKDIKETEGEQRGAYIYAAMCSTSLLKTFPLLTCFSFIFSPVSKQTEELPGVLS